MEVELKKHVAIYLKHFNYGEQDFIPCEACKALGLMVRAVDVHHLNGRGKGKDVIENLVGLCRNDHNEAHRNPTFNSYLKELVKDR